MKNTEQYDLSRQYWEAIDRQDYDWSDFIDSCLEREGLKRLEKSECGIKN